MITGAAWLPMPKDISRSRRLQRYSISFDIAQSVDSHRTFYPPEIFVNIACANLQDFWGLGIVICTQFVACDQIPYIPI
jgi:hypothetical protein